MRYAVIYTVDVPKHGNPDDFAPPEDGPWQQTEGDSQFETPDRFAADAEDLFGWAKGHHRKHSADLDEEQFEEFLSKCELVFVDGEGSMLGGMGFTRAVVFQGQQDEDCQQEAYVTPHCEVNELPKWLREHCQLVPVNLIDSPRQRYMFCGQDRREPFEAVSDCLRTSFG